MKSYQTRVSPKSNMTGILLKTGKFGHRHTIGWKRQILKCCSYPPSNTKDCWQSPEARKTRKDPALEPLEGIWP